MGMVLLPAASFHPHHHHHHHHQHETLMPSTDHPIIPLLTAAPCLIDEENSASAAAARTKASAAAAGIQIWQSAQPQPHHHIHHNYPPPAHNPNPSPTLPYLKKPMPMLDSSGILTAVGASVVGGGITGGATTCQDCGNQAKKDCSHRRCRSCCKSRGYDCVTHVKSTWVPAARRRERQHLGAGAAGSSASTSASKKPRLVTSHAAAATTTTTSHTSTSNTTPRSFDTSSSHHQDASFRDSLPGHVRAPAVFKCVRVTSIDDGEDEYAYHAMVKIGGHVFKGFLYDQGPDDSQANTTSKSNNAAGSSAFPNIADLHLGGRNGSIAGASSSSPMLPPSDIYGGAPGGSSGLIGGPNFGNQIN